MMTKTKRIRARPSTTNKGLVIDVSGVFNLEVRREFCEAYESQGQRYSRYAVNLRNCTGLDSTGLGMLLMLRDYSGLGKKDLFIIHCSQEVRQVLRYASFDQLFTIKT